ncbi:uncharacterized protein LOC144339733 [Macaca mulatta]
MALRARGLAALAGERAGRRLGGCALSSISASGGGSRGEAEGAGPRGPRSCPAQPSPGEAAARTSGTRGPGPSARQIAAVSGEVRAPVGRGHLPEGLGLGGISGLPSTPVVCRLPGAEGQYGGTARVSVRGCQAPGEQR